MRGFLYSKRRFKWKPHFIFRIFLPIFSVLLKPCHMICNLILHSNLYRQNRNFFYNDALPLLLLLESDLFFLLLIISFLRSIFHKIPYLKNQQHLKVHWWLFGMHLHSRKYFRFFQHLCLWKFVYSIFYLNIYYTKSSINWYIWFTKYVS